MDLTAWLVAHPIGGGVLLYVLFGLLALLFGRKSQIDAWVERNPRLSGAMKIIRGVGLDPWLPLQGLCLLVFGRLPKTDWFKPKLPPGVGGATLLILMAAAALASLGCSAVPVSPTCSNEAFRNKLLFCAAAATRCVQNGGTDAECGSVCDKEWSDWQDRCSQ